MKFSEFFTAIGLRRLSIWFGILIGVVSTAFADWRISVIIGACAVLILSFLLPLIFYIKFLPYRKMKKSLGEDRVYIFDEPVRFIVKTGVVGGFFLLTEKSMIFMALDSDVKTLELTRDKVVRVSVGEDLNLDIYLSNTQFVRVFAAAHKEIVEILREHGWNIVS